MIDSGSQSSLISEDYISRHQLTSTPLRPAILIRGLDSKPLSKGSISHVATCKVKIGDHSELKTFGIVKMPWDLLLGVDWLRTHNPEISWKSCSIHFSCCDSGHLGMRFTTLASGSLDLDSESIDVAILSAHDLFRMGNISHMGFLSLSPAFTASCATTTNPVNHSMLPTFLPEGNPSQSSCK